MKFWTSRRASPVTAL